MSRVKELAQIIIASVFTIAFFISFLALAIYCNSPHSGPTDSRFGLQDTPIASRIIMDQVTGVYYLVLQDDGIAVTPLLNVDGLPMCVDDANHGDVESALSSVRANVQRWEAAE